MKGLLIKDWKLLMKQKNMLIYMFVLVLMFLALRMAPEFIVTYTMMVMLFQTVGTVSYDDFDNGMAFLFVLPIDRKTYVREKYILGIVTSIVAWTFAAGIDIIGAFMLGNSGAQAGIEDMLMSLFVIFPVGLIMWEILLPSQLKYGAEKARIVLIIVAGVVVVSGVILSKILSSQQEKMLTIKKMVENLTPMQVAVTFLVVAIAGLWISYISSVRIMKKKEY